MEEYFIYGAIALFVIIIGYQFKKKKKKKETRPLENGILVNIGDQARRAKMESAVQMILQTPYKDYVLHNLSVIKESNLTGVNTGSRPAIFNITYKYIDTSDLKWLASVLVHEARHVEQHHDLGGYKGQESELDANRKQADVLRYLGGSQQQIKYLESADGLHFDTNGNGLLDPKDNWNY